MTKWIRVPIIKEIDPRTMWEHPPLDYYKYGEYPRFIRPPHSPDCEWKWERRITAIIFGS
jgi:hypothetical protein